MDKVLWALFAVFAPLSLVTIGGGQATVAEIQRQVVDVHHWMTAQQFLNDFAISRLAPGPGSLLVTLIGWQVGGLWGAVVATLAIFGPTAFLIYGVAHLWRDYGPGFQIVHFSIQDDHLHLAAEAKGATAAEIARSPRLLSLRAKRGLETKDRDMIRRGIAGCCCTAGRSGNSRHASPRRMVRP